MPHHIFFSWQSDTMTRTGRNLIERALERALRTLKADAEIDPADRELAIDRDSSGMPGSPPLVETIFNKIDRAAVFLSDLTYVSERANGDRYPNPNVLLEHGWALRSLTWRGVVSVMNIAHGGPKEHPLPFDLRHFLWPITYDCPDDADDERRAAVREALAADLVRALRTILKDDVLREGRQPAAPAVPHPHDVALLALIHRQFPVGLRRFLHRHNFGSSFRRALLDPLHEMNEDWVGAAYEFHDAALAAAFVEVRKASEAFGALVAERIHVQDRNPDMAWPKTDIDVARGIQPETLEAVGRLNALASGLSDAFDAFERVARDRVRVDLTIGSAPTEDPRLAAAQDGVAGLDQDRMRGGVPEIVSPPFVTIRIAPLSAFEGRRLDPAKVAEAQRRFPPDAKVRVKSGSDMRQWWSCGVPDPRTGLNAETRWRTRLVRPGMLEHGETIGVRIDDDEHIVIDGRDLERTIVAALLRGTEALTCLGMTGRALLSIGFQGVEDVILQRARPGGNRIGMPMLVLPLIDIPDIAEPVGPWLHEPLDMLWQASGWPDGSPSFGTGKWVP